MHGPQTILLTFLLLPAMIFAGPADPLGPHFALFPAPQKIEIGQGKGLLYAELQEVVVENADQARLLSGYPGRLPVRFPGVEAAGALSLHIEIGRAHV